MDSGDRPRSCTTLTAVAGERDPARVLKVLDGRAEWAQLRRLCTVHAVRQSLAQGRIVRAGKGLYVLPDLSAARTAAASVGGVLSHLSAARELGLTLLRSPDEVHVAVPRGSRRAAPPGVVLHHLSLAPHEISRTSTSVLRTVTDCAIALPLAESLAVADSALREGLLGREDLLAAAAGRRGPGRERSSSTSSTPGGGSPSRRTASPTTAGAGSSGTTAAATTSSSPPAGWSCGSPGRT